MTIIAHTHVLFSCFMVRFSEMKFSKFEVSIAISVLTLEQIIIAFGEFILGIDHHF